MLDVTRLRVLVAVARYGSVTAAARALNYAQPSVSHHISRLEAETGAQLLQRAGRGVRLADAGRLLAGRAEEIIGRLDAAEAELAAHVGLREDRVALAAFGSALGTIVPAAAAELAAAAPGAELLLTEAEPPEALRMLQAGYVDIAVVFEYCQQEPADDPPAGSSIRRQLLLDEPVYLITTAGLADGAGQIADLAAQAGQRWIAGCERCRGQLLRQCAGAGFVPCIAFTTDDYVAAQALVAAGLGVATLPALALRAARHPGVSAAELPGCRRRVVAMTYGDPPDPPASLRVIDLLAAAAAAVPGGAADT